MPVSPTADIALPLVPGKAKVRKRASKACLCCRARKVRCDVSQRGRPCMNCYLDGETCVVTGRASKQAGRPLMSSVLSPVILSAVRESRALAGDLDTSTLRRAARDDSPDTNGGGSKQLCSSPGLDSARNGSVNIARDQSQATKTIGGLCLDTIATSTATTTPPTHLAAVLTTAETRCPSEHSLPIATLVNNDTLGGSFSSVQAEVNNSDCTSNALLDPLQTLDTLAALRTSQSLHITTHDQDFAHITYAYFPFLTVTNLSKLLPQDVNYLEQQGCMRIPTRPILDEFVQQYFLHVHPMMPLFHEGDFWDMYSQTDSPRNITKEENSANAADRMALLSFQALLFATCNFISETSINALGFPTIRAARAVFYRRAKLLYDFDTEPSAVACSQAALLLTFWSPYGNKKINTVWLSAAVQQARLADAHSYDSMPDTRHTNVLKRLWWSCLIRDRLLSLGVRRTLQIPRAQFDVDRHPPLNTADLADEIAYSRVYNLETKKHLVAVVVHIAELCVVLTDVLAMAYPADWPVWDRQKLERDMGQVQLCRAALNHWSESVSQRQSLYGLNSPVTVNSGNHYLHDSIVLYTHLMHIYYHSGRIALCHYETLNMILYSSIQGPTIANLNISLGNLSVGPGQDASAIQKNRNDLQDAASEVAESLKELVRRRLARWLPISAVPMTALPLFLQTVDVKLSSMSIGTSSHSDISTSTLKQRRLNDLVEAMRTYQPQYEGVDWVSESICHAVKLAQLSAVQVSHPKSRGARDWTDILVSNPSCYLRLAFSVDIALRTNRLPEEDDFPIGIRGVLPGGSGPIRNLFCLIESPAVIPGAPGDMPVKDKRRAKDVETIFPGSMTTVSLTPPSLSVDMGLNIADEYPLCYDVDMSISGLFDELGMLDVNLDVCPDGSITNVQDSRVLVDDTEEDGVSF